MKYFGPIEYISLVIGTITIVQMFPSPVQSSRSFGTIWGSVLI